MNLNEIITYAPNVTICVTANDVVGTIKIMDVDASGTETGLVLAVLPEGAVSQTPVTLQSGSIKAIAESGATVGSLQVLRPVAPFRTAAAIASNGGGIPIMDGEPFAYTNQYGELQPIKAYDAFYGGEIIEEFSDSIKRADTQITAGKYKLIIESITANECGSGSAWIEVPATTGFQAPIPSVFNLSSLNLSYLGVFAQMGAATLLIEGNIQKLNYVVKYQGTGSNYTLAIDHISGVVEFTIINTQPIKSLLQALAVVADGEGNIIPVAPDGQDSYFVSYKLIKL